jgi:hypothetical protein
VALSRAASATAAAPAGGTAQAAVERCCRRPRASTIVPSMLRWGCSVWEIIRVGVRVTLVRSPLLLLVACSFASTGRTFGAPACGSCGQYVCGVGRRKGGEGGSEGGEGGRGRRGCTSHENTLLSASLIRGWKSKGTVPTVNINSLLGNCFWGGHQEMMLPAREAGGASKRGIDNTYINCFLAA